MFLSLPSTAARHRASERSAAAAATTGDADDQGLTLGHFSAQRKQISWDAFGELCIRQSIRQGRGTRVGDKYGLG